MTYSPPSRYLTLTYRVILGFSHFSLTGTVSTSPNLAKRKRVARQSLLALRARALAKFGEVDTVPVS